MWPGREVPRITVWVRGDRCSQLQKQASRMASTTGDNQKSPFKKKNTECEHPGRSAEMPATHFEMLCSTTSIKEARLVSKGRKGQLCITKVEAQQWVCWETVTLFLHASNFE